MLKGISENLLEQFDRSHQNYVHMLMGIKKEMLFHLVDYHLQQAVRAHADVTDDAEKAARRISTQNALAVLLREVRRRGVYMECCSFLDAQFEESLKKLEKWERGLR